MSKEIKKSEAEATKEAPAATETKQEAAPAAAAPAAEAPKAEAAPAPKLANGLFQSFTLGSTLKPGVVGNVMDNMKKPAMDYEKQYQNSTKNQKLSAEELQKLSSKK